MMVLLVAVGSTLAVALLAFGVWIGRVLSTMKAPPWQLVAVIALASAAGGLLAAWDVYCHAAADNQFTLVDYFAYAGWFLMLPIFAVSGGFHGEWASVQIKLFPIVGNVILFGGLAGGVMVLVRRRASAKAQETAPS